MGSRGRCDILLCFYRKINKSVENTPGQNGRGRFYGVMGSALAHQADVELHRTADDLGADPLIVAVDGAALLGGEVHGGEAVNMVADGAVMTAVAALYHQVRGDKRALPSARYGGSDLIPCGAVGLTDGAGVHALDAAQRYGVIADDQIGRASCRERV